MRPMKDRVNLTLDEDLLEKLRFYAQDDDRSLSQFVNHSLWIYMNWFERMHKRKRS